MKKYVSFILILILLIGSFYYADKVSNFIINKSPLMKTLKSNKDKYEIKSVDAIVSDEYIIPGIEGKKVSEIESYYNMKKYNTFVSDKLIYKSIIPSISLEKNKDLIYPELERKSAKIENAMKNAGLNVNRVGSIMTAFFTDKKVVDYDTATTADTKRYAEYYNHLLENGIYAAPSQFEAMFVSFAHTEDDIEKTCQVIESFK